MKTGVKVFPLCGGRSKSQQVPEILRAFSEALRDSKMVTALSVLSQMAAFDLRTIHKGLVVGTTYQNDPNCQDFAQTLEASITRQREEGVFGDCGAYAVTVSSLASALGLGVGEWLLLGDASDGAQHIVNRFGNIIIDATEPNGFMWQIPARFTVRQVVDPLSGRVVAHA